MPLMMNELKLLIRALQSSDSETRESAAHALSDLGVAARPAVPSLFDAILREPGACPWVGTALTQLGPLAPDTKSLALALRNKNSHVRFWAARTVVNLGPMAETLISDLIGILCDQHHPVTDSAIWALGAIGPAAITPLIAATRSHDPELRARSALALGRYYVDAAHKLPAIVELLDDSVTNVRNHAALAICYLGQSAHPDPTIYDPDTFAMLVRALDHIADDPAIDVDTEWLKRVHGRVRPNG